MGSPTKGHLVDMGCGVGSVAAYMSRFAPQLQFTSVTNSARQLALMEERGVPGRILLSDYRQVDQLASGSADVLLYCETLGYSAPDLTMGEAYRLLAPGGSVYCFDFARTGPSCPAEASWGYRFFWSGMLISAAEAQGLVCESFRRLATSVARYEQFWASSELMRTRHPKGSCEVGAALYHFTKPKQ